MSTLIPFPFRGAQAGTVIYRRALRAGLPVQVAREMERITRAQVRAGRSPASALARIGTGPRRPGPEGAA